MNHIENVLSDSNLFSELQKYGIINSSEIPEKINMLMKKKLESIHTGKIYTRKDGRIFTKVIDNGKEKQINGKDETDLYAKLYDFYFGESNSSLETLYPQWIAWREEESSVSKKTIKENMYLWDTFLKGTDISKAPLKRKRQISKCIDFLFYLWDNDPYSKNA